MPWLERVAPPRLVGSIPIDRRTQTSFEIAKRFPSDLLPDLGGIQRIPPVVSRSILGELDQVLAFAKVLQNLSRHAQVRQWRAASHIIDLAGMTLQQHIENRSAIVGNMNPVTNLQPITVDR